MAAGDEFPLEVILIIVAVIVVLFIAIFFGGRFISTRLRKRKVFTDPSRPSKLAVGVGERSGAGKYRYNGGDDIDTIINFMKESQTSLKNITKINNNFKYISTDVVHNIFRKLRYNSGDPIMLNIGDYIHGDDSKLTDLTNNINLLPAETTGKVVEDIEDSRSLLGKIIKSGILEKNKPCWQQTNIEEYILELINTANKNIESFDAYTPSVYTYVKTKLNDKIDRLSNLGGGGAPARSVEYFDINDQPLIAREIFKILKDTARKQGGWNKIDEIPKFLKVFSVAKPNKINNIDNAAILDEYVHVGKVINANNDEWIIPMNAVYNIKGLNDNQKLLVIFQADKLNGWIESDISTVVDINTPEYTNFKMLIPDTSNLNSALTALKTQADATASKPSPGGGSKVSTNPGNSTVTGSIGSSIDKNKSYQYLLNIINTKLYAISNAKRFGADKKIDTAETIKLRNQLLNNTILKPLKTSKLLTNSESIITEFDKIYLDKDATTGAVSPKDEGFFGNKPKLDDITNNLIRLLGKNITDFETNFDDINTALYNSGVKFIEQIIANSIKNADTLDEAMLLSYIKQITEQINRNSDVVYTPYVLEKDKHTFIANVLIFNNVLDKNGKIQNAYKNLIYKTGPAPNDIEILKNAFKLYGARLKFYTGSISKLLELIKIITDYNINVYKLKGLNMYIHDYITQADFANIVAIYKDIYMINKHILQNNSITSKSYTATLPNAKGAPLLQKLVESIYANFGTYYAAEKTIYLRLIGEFEKKDSKITKTKKLFESADKTVNTILKATKLDTSVQGNIDKYNKLVTDNNTIDLSWFTALFNKKVTELQAAATLVASVAASTAARKQIIQDANIILTSSTNNYKIGEAIVKNIEVKNGVNLDTQLEEFKESVDNQLGFAANIDAKKSEFESKTGGASTSQTSDFDEKYNSVYEQTSKFIALLGRVHGVTKYYQGKYSKIMGDLSAGLHTLSLSKLTDKLSDIDPPYISATKLSEASADVSEKLELHMHDITSNEGILHKEITDINTEITTTHKGTKDGLNKAITDRAQDEVTQAVADVTARADAARTEITRITGIKNTIKSDIDEKIMSDKITPANALLQTDTTTANIADLQTAITALQSIPVTKFEDLILGAAGVYPVIDTTGLEDKIEEYNDLIPTVANFATECTNKILTDAVAKANTLVAKCVTDLGNVTPMLIDPVQYALDVVGVRLVYIDMVKYVEIVGKITNKKGTDYDKIIESQDRLVRNIGNFGLDLTTHVKNLKQTISDTITQSSTISNGINSGSALVDVQAAIKQLADIQTQNSNNFKIIRDIGNNPNIVSLLTPGIIPKKYMTDTPKNMQKVNDALVKSEKLEEEVKITSAAKAAATAYASAAAAVATSIAAAADTVTLKTAADGVKEAITKIKTGYDTEYDLKAAAVKNAALANVKTITDNLPKFKTYIDNTETYIGTIKANIVLIPNTPPTTNINDAEITSLNAKVTTLEHELAVIKPLYNDLNTWNTLDTTIGSTLADVAINAAITANVQTSFTDAIRDADAICDAIIAGIANRTISTLADIATKNAELNNIMTDTIPKTILPEKTTVIDALNADVSAEIKTNVIDPNAAKVATIDNEIAKKSLNTVITDALAASKTLVDAITNEKAAIEKIITDDIGKLPNLITIANDQQLIVSNIDKGDILTDPKTRRYTQEKINAIEAYRAIRGPPGSREIVDKIPQHVKTITDNLATITTAKTAIDAADTVSSDPAKSLAEQIDGMVKIYTEYNKVKTLKSICDTSNAEIKKLKGDLDVFVKVIELSDTIVKDNIAVFNINENAQAKLATATGIRNADQQRKTDADNLVLNMQAKVGNITAKVSSIQNRDIASALVTVGAKMTDLTNKSTDITDKLVEINTELGTLTAAATSISTKLGSFKSAKLNFAKNLAFWIDQINNNPKIYTNMSKISNTLNTRSNDTNVNMNLNKLNRRSAEMGRLEGQLQIAKNAVQTALTHVNSVYQLIIMDDDDDDAPAVTQQDDDKVKPFSQNSYDILPLDPKVATLSSNMQFSESKSTATNNPGNSFMYTIVPYDSQELSSDDRVLEIISFARTQRMPLKDAANIIIKAGELLKKYRGTKKVIPGAWVYRGGKLFSSVKPTKIEELERYIELMRRSLTISDGFDRGSRSGGGANTKRE
jgi:hypothetical protein